MTIGTSFQFVQAGFLLRVGKEREREREKSKWTSYSFKMAFDVLAKLTG